MKTKYQIVYLPQPFKKHLEHTSVPNSAWEIQLFEETSLVSIRNTIWGSKSFTKEWIPLRSQAHNNLN